ncbi:MAG: peptide deformylase [Parcubacteria group bacterium Gr01-1014_20]|nr:MAG: peptide deformylase [Parcubacteria group bacterium Gr01-1014_20]
MKIFEISQKSEEKILRKKTEEFLFGKKGEVTIGKKNLSKGEVAALIHEMKKTMRHANGIGLSANQVGLSYRLFVAEVGAEDGSKKFYAIFNPKIERSESKEKALLEEGCLSIPRTFGEVERYKTVRLTGFDKFGRSLKIKAWGLLAHVFQHEVDHLDGKLFTDVAKKIHKVPAPPPSS